MNASISYLTRIANSALWSGYGDALGFITELRDNERAIYARIGSDRVSRTIAWKRRVGGKFGVEATLSAGCYSDDTQLRLATGRSIRPDSSFNIEAFAKMELPVWTSYALGAGRGSKAAATALSREGVNWFSNFYEADSSAYIKSGGNGAAMRIQPHVWAAKQNASFRELIDPVIKNSVSTHGHARGIIGAVFHAMCLDHARRSGAIPDKRTWVEIVGNLRELSAVIDDDADLKTFWLPVWEQRSGANFKTSCIAIQKELLRDIEILSEVPLLKTKNETYRAAVERIGAFDESERGSATKTALLAVFLADMFSSDGPEEALICAANCLSSDTDTIATMAGAIMGLVINEEPPGELMDKSYILAQASRLARISTGEPTEQTHYPNLLNWKPPRTQQESIVIGDRGLEVLILGKVAAEGQKFETKRNEPFLWQWLRLESGQNILAKRRKRPMQMRSYQQAFIPKKTVMQTQIEQVNQSHLPLGTVSPKVISQKITVDDLTRQAIQAHFDPQIIGQHILLLSSSSDGIEQAIAYTAIIAKARLARNKHGA